MVVASHTRSRTASFFSKARQTVGVLFAVLVYLVCQPTFAQFCTGQSGELLINESFGTAQARPSLAGRTTYARATEPCPLDGTYTLADTVAGNCFQFTWHTVVADHTPNDARGNMLVINGAYGAGAFYEQPLTTLCSGASYELSVWAINLLKPGTCTYPLLPDLTISIETKDGRVIQTTPIGSIQLTASPTWVRYAAVFTAPVTDEAVIVKLIDNQGDAGCGNDLAIDDIQLKQCSACQPESVYVPDAFTPNNDGHNDALTIATRETVAFDLKIYNRWGSLVFTSNTKNQGWDGTYNGLPCQPDQYTWVVTYRSAQSARLGTDLVRTGQVLLVR